MCPFVKFKTISCILCSARPCFMCRDSQFRKFVQSIEYLNILHGLERELVMVRRYHRKHTMKVTKIWTFWWMFKNSIFPRKVYRDYEAICNNVFLHHWTNTERWPVHTMNIGIPKWSSRLNKRFHDEKILRNDIKAAQRQWLEITRWDKKQSWKNTQVIDSPQHSFNQFFQVQLK